MPKILNRERLNKVQYISMSDYIRSMDVLTDFEDKLAFTTRYLLAYGGEDNRRDVPFAEAIHIAKMKMADASMEARRKSAFVSDLAVNPYVNDELDAMNRKFMIDPIEYLKDEANHLIVEAASENDSPEKQQRIANYQLMSAILTNSGNTSLEYDIGTYDEEPMSTANDVRSRIKAYFGGKNELKRAYKATKPGFLSRLFNTSSIAYHNLETVYKAFNNDNHILHNDVNSLEKAAKEYLQHVFPKWDPEDGMLTKAHLETLSGTQKARAEFSFSIYKSIVLEHKSKEVYDKVINSNIQKRSDDIVKAMDNNNNDFHQNLLSDVNNKEENLSDSQAEEKYAANFADDPELGDE